MSNTFVHSALGASVAIATTEAPPLVKSAVVAGLFLSHVLFDIVPHGHLVDLGWFGERKSYHLESWVGLLAIPIAVWYITGANPYWGFICCISPNLFDCFCFFGWKWANKLNEIIHPWVGKATRTQIIFADVIVHLGVFAFLAIQLWKYI